MQMQLYSVYDEKTQVYMVMAPRVNDATIMRELKRELTRGGMMSEFPGDYSLYSVGTWNDALGEVKGHIPRLVCRLDKLMSEAEAERGGVESPPVESSQGGVKPHSK
jgi:hypothetical protein